jgi:hypothetical protein
MPQQKRIKHRWAARIGHGSKKNVTVYATWDYFKKVARTRNLSIAELLERAVTLYDINNVPSIKELEQFREDLRARIKLMEYRIGTSRPTDIDLSILDYYREMLIESKSLMPSE